MGNNSDMDWAQHFKMNHAQNLRKDSVNHIKGQKNDLYAHWECHCLIIASNGGNFFACLVGAKKNKSQIFWQWLTIFNCVGTKNR